MTPSNEGSRGIEQSPQLDFFDQEMVQDIGRRLAAAGGGPMSLGSPSILPTAP